MNTKMNLTMPHFPILFLLTGYVLIALYFGVFLQFDFLRSDVLGYWQDSLAWQSPFHPFHVPAYPFMIAVLRGITFGRLPPISLMMCINLAAFLASAFLLYRILQAGGASDELAAIGTLLFGLWPFVGLTFTVYPLSDMPAMFFLLAGLYLLQGSRRKPAALLLGIALVTHKAMWIFIGPLIISDFLYRKEFISKRNFLFLGIALLPIGVLWISGSIYHHSITWLFSSNLEVEVASKGITPLFDGLLGTFMEGGIKGVVKGILLLSFTVISALMLYLSFRFKYEYFQFGITISLAILILFIVLNQHEIWAAMRFGRLLVIPLAFVANTQISFDNKSSWFSSAIITVLFFLFLSQFAYAFYMARIFFG